MVSESTVTVDSESWHSAFVESGVECGTFWRVKYIAIHFLKINFALFY